MVFMHIIFGLHLVIYFVVLHSKGTVFSLNMSSKSRVRYI